MFYLIGLIYRILYPEPFNGKVTKYGCCSGKADKDHQMGIPPIAGAARLGGKW